MAPVLSRALLFYILVAIHATALATTFPETCRKSSTGKEVRMFVNRRRDSLDFRYLSDYQGEFDGVLMMKAFNNYLYNIISNIPGGFHEWNTFSREVNDLLGGIDEICTNHDTDYSTDAFPYDCYNKEHWCSMKEFLRQLKGKIDLTRPGESNWLKRWTGFFNPPPPDTNWGNAFDNEIEIVCQIFFYHSSLGTMTEKAKEHREQLKSKIVDRVYYYVRTNNMEYLKLFLEQLGWVKEDFSEACGDSNDEFVCTIKRIFSTVAAMIEDTDTFSWNFETQIPRTREVIAMLWLVIPAEVRGIFPSIADDDVVRERMQRYLQILFDNVVSKTEGELESLLSHSTHLQTRSEAECNDPTNDISDGLECIFYSVTKHANDLISAVKSGNWGERRTLDIRSAILVGLIATKTNSYIEYTTAQTREFVIDSFERIYFYVKQNDIEGLDQYTKSMPAPDTLQTTQGQRCSEFFNDLKSRIPCLFNNMLREIFVFMNSQKRAPLNTKVISTQFDYKTLLQSAQLASISTQIEQQTLEIKANLAEWADEIKTFVSQDTGRKFSALEEYFQGIADFDERKANADIAFIAGRLTGFDDQINELKPDLEERLMGIINGSLLANMVDTVQRAGELVVKSAFACNPLDPDPGAVIDSVNDLAQSVVNVMRSEALKRLFGAVVDQTTSVAKRISENNDFIENVRTIVTDLPNQVDDNEAFTEKTTEFLDKYAEYDPKVQRQEIAAMEGSWEAFIEEGCDTMFAGGTAASGVVESIFANKGDCLTTHAKINKLVETFSEIYDYQFDLMETLATAVRAYQSKFFSRRLDTNLRVIGEEDLTDESDNEAVNLNEAMLNFFLIYRMHTTQILSQYCNYLEFKNAGEMPSVCPNALHSLEQNDISRVIAFSPASCTPESFKFVEIPTTDSNNEDKRGFINTTRLYSGEEIPFKIPNIDWLLRHEWITNADARDTAIYVTAFELFLPSDGTPGSRKKISNKQQSDQSKIKITKSEPGRSLMKKSFLTKKKLIKSASSSVPEQGRKDVSLNLMRSRRSSTEREIRFKITARHSAPLFFEDESDRYGLQPNRRYIFTYQENADSCRQDRIDNPYSSSLPELCPVSLKPDDNDVNPSVFSLWKIKLQAPTFENIPEVANTPLKAAIRLCKVKKPSTVSKKKRNKKKEGKKE
eukprot:gene6424-7157_t